MAELFVIVQVVLIFGKATLQRHIEKRKGDRSQSATDLFFGQYINLNTFAPVACDKKCPFYMHSFIANCLLGLFYLNFVLLAVYLAFFF